LKASNDVIAKYAFSHNRLYAADFLWEGSFMLPTFCRTSSFIIMVGGICYLSLFWVRWIHFTTFSCCVQTSALSLAFSALVWRIRLTKVTHAIARALNVLNGVENSNACSSARDSDLNGFTFNIAFNFTCLYRQYVFRWH